MRFKTLLVAAYDATPLGSGAAMGVVLDADLDPRRLPQYLEDAFGSEAGQSDGATYVRALRDSLAEELDAREARP